MELKRYVTANGVDVFHEWFTSLRDKQARVNIRRRLDRIKADNFGQIRYTREGVWEIKIDVGPGYRVYYAQAGQTIVLLALRRRQEHPGCRHRSRCRLLGKLSTTCPEAMMLYAPSRSDEEAVIEELRDDPQFAAELLNAIIEDGDQQELMLVLRRLAKAFGGVSKLAEQAELNAKTLYRTLSVQGNPELKSLRALLGAMGMRLAVQPIVRVPSEQDLLAA